MKGWKIFAVTAFAVIAVSVITVSAYAYCTGGRGFFGPYGNYSSNQVGGPVSSGYPNYANNPTTTSYTNQTYANPITIDQAVIIAKGYLTLLNNPDLTVGEVEEYTQNFYVSYYEKSTGMGAFEMLIDKYSGNIYPETGPNMMWNTRYGMMRGTMCCWQGTPSTPMSITIAQANATAQQFLNTYYPGTTVGDIMPFYGYYHVEVLLSGKTHGMLSVNGYTGQVWYHTWHGDFIQQVELYLPNPASTTYTPPTSTYQPPNNYQPPITNPPQYPYYPSQGGGRRGCCR